MDLPPGIRLSVAYRSETGGGLDAVNLVVILGWIGLVVLVSPDWL